MRTNQMVKNSTTYRSLTEMFRNLESKEKVSVNILITQLNAKHEAEAIVCNKIEIGTMSWIVYAKDVESQSIAEKI